jgi:hypothetical protein
VATPIRRTERRLSCALLLTFAGVSQGAEPPQFATHRYDDDWSAYCERVDQPVLDRMKCLPLPSEIVGHLSFGGEWRERFEAVDSPDFGIGTSSDEYLLHRLLLHADLKFGHAVRVFAQLGYHDESGRTAAPHPPTAMRQTCSRASSMRRSRSATAVLLCAPVARSSRSAAHGSWRCVSRRMCVALSTVSV